VRVALPWTEQEQAELRGVLLPGVDCDAVLIELAGLHAAAMNRWARDQRIRPAVRLHQWEDIERMTEELARAIHRVKPLRTDPDADWFYPLLAELQKANERARDASKDFESLRKAYERTQDPFREEIYIALLRIWTGPGGGQLRISRVNGEICGPLIRYLLVACRLVDAFPTPSLSGLAKIIEREKCRRFKARSPCPSDRKK
jgi:hypothetical protein